MKQGLVLYILQFFEFNVVVNYQKIAEMQSEFPSITLCNINSLDISERQSTGEYLMQILTTNSLQSFLTVNDTEDAINKVEDYANVIKASLIYALKKRGFDDIFRLGFTLNKLVISCYYNEVKCDLQEFFQFFDFQYGNCYTFNPFVNSNGTVNKSPKISTQAGTKNGNMSNLRINN